MRYFRIGKTMIGLSRGEPATVDLDGNRVGEVEEVDEAAFDAANAAADAELEAALKKFHDKAAKPKKGKAKK